MLVLLGVGGAWSIPAAALNKEAQELAAALAYFEGKSRLIPESGRREPQPELLGRLQAQLDQLLPAPAATPEPPVSLHRAQLTAAQALVSQPNARREMLAIAARRALPPRARGAAALVLAWVRDDLAVAALAMALPEQEDPRLAQELIQELLLALRRTGSRPALTPDDTQFLAISRRILLKLACEESPIWDDHARQLEAIRRLDQAGDKEKAVQLLELASLPATCLERHVAGLANLPDPSSSERLWRNTLQRLEERLSEAQLNYEPALQPPTLEAVQRLIGAALEQLSDARALAAALNLAVLVNAKQVSPLLEPLITRTRSEHLARMVRRTQSILRGETLLRD